MTVGPRNLITDVAGLTVGNAADSNLLSGVTVVLPEAPAVAAADIRGGAPATRDMDGLVAGRLVERVHGLVFSGGSGFGLDAGGGLQAWLAARGRGLAFGGAVVPVVPTAILFDLTNGGDKTWGDTPPYRALGQAAAAAAGADFALGNAGAGMGATAGALKGGLGSVSWVYDQPAGPPVTVGALAAVNPMGAVVTPDDQGFWAAPYAQAGELGTPTPLVPVGGDLSLPAAGDGTHTTLVAVATDAILTKTQALRVAIMAQDGLARAIRPVHSPFDGDVVVCLSTEKVAIGDDPWAVAQLGHVAADCVARAVARGVYAAEAVGRWPSYRGRLNNAGATK